MTQSFQAKRHNQVKEFTVELKLAEAQTEKIFELSSSTGESIISFETSRQDPCLYTWDIFFFGNWHKKCNNDVLFLAFRFMNTKPRRWQLPAFWKEDTKGEGSCLNKSSVWMGITLAELQWFILASQASSAKIVHKKRLFTSKRKTRGVFGHALSILSDQLSKNQVSEKSWRDLFLRYSVKALIDCFASVLKTICQGNLTDLMNFLI